MEYEKLKNECQALYNEIQWIPAFDLNFKLRILTELNLFINSINNLNDDKIKQVWEQINNDIEKLKNDPIFYITDKLNHIINNIWYIIKNSLSIVEFTTHYLFIFIILFILIGIFYFIYD